MGEVFAELERDLERWKVQYRGKPRKEMLKLLLLALEREEIVSVGYREEAIGRRLLRMPIPEGVREVIRKALIWVWKDEEMHAIYIRGALLKIGNRRLRVQAFLQQFAGAIGGWSSSVLQHTRWRQAPLSRLLAQTFTLLGVMAGKVSASIWQELGFKPFRDFCVFNIDAEKTAVLCWSRLSEISTQCGDFPHATVVEMRKMQSDEENHARIFEVLAASFDGKDRLVDGLSEDLLAERIRDVGAFFVSRERRTKLPADDPLGTGGEVVVLEGRTSGEKVSLFRKLLEDSGLKEVVRERAERSGKRVEDLRAAVKTSFMMGYHRKDLSPIVDPVLVKELALCLAREGVRDIAVVESKNLYDKFFKERSVRQVAEYFRMDLSPARIVDLSDEQESHSFERGMAQYSVGRSWKEADLRISFGKLRTHPIDQVHLSVANLEAMGSRCDEFLFTERQAHRDSAIMTLISDFPPHFAILEGYDLAPDGLLGVMGSPRPRCPMRLYAGRDAIAVDCVAARHLGVKDPKDSAVLRMAFHWFGDPQGSIRVRGADGPVPLWHGPQHNELSALLSFVAFPVYSFASGRGALFVPEMDEEAFPPVKPPRWTLRLARKLLQALLGLRHGR